MRVSFSRTSLKYLQRLQKNIIRKIVDAIDRLPDEGDIRKLKGTQVDNLYRLRMGKYRVIYQLGSDFIKIIRIDTRGDVYK
jgi:mRNA interferase RelE/StbE